MECAIIVPARLGSQRLPRKLMQEVLGKPLILHTAANVRRIAPRLPLFFAVAERELEEVLTGEGYDCILTDPDLPSGTDRLAVANCEVGAEKVINVQADEPTLQEAHINLLLRVMEREVDMATLATRFSDEKDFKDPNKVKVVTDLEERALYFSRSPIPYFRDGTGSLPGMAFWHLGLYGYRRKLLEQFRGWAPSPLESMERLEQLRMLEHGGSIGVGITEHRTIGVDTREDLQNLKKFLDLPA